MSKRSGLSYLEVLIAAGIALTGILGAVAMFPVAISNLQKGQVVDVMASIGPSVLEQTSTLHIDDPRWWMFRSGGAYTEVQRDFASPGYLPRPNMQNRNLSIDASIQPWTCFCFDPRMLAQSPTFDAAQNDPQVFPAIPVAAGSSRMLRTTLAASSIRNAGGQLSPLGVAQSRMLFKCQDELNFSRPTVNAVLGQADANTMPAQQEPLRDSTNTVQRRDYLANYEWLITATPAVEFTFDQLSGPTVRSTGKYNVAAAIIYQRQTDLSAIVNNQTDPTQVEEERLVDVNQFVGSGINGGEVLLQTRANRPQSDLSLQNNNWVLLSAQQTLTLQTPNGPVQTQPPLPYFSWYRVTAVGEAYSTNGAAPPFQRYVTLEGADVPANTSNHQIVLVSGCVGVFTGEITLQ